MSKEAGRRNFPSLGLIRSGKGNEERVKNRIKKRKDVWLDTLKHALRSPNSEIRKPKEREWHCLNKFCDVIFPQTEWREKEDVQCPCCGAKNEDIEPVSKE